MEKFKNCMTGLLETVVTLILVAMLLAIVGSFKIGKDLGYGVDNRGQLFKEEAVMTLGSNTFVHRNSDVGTIDYCEDIIDYANVHFLK